MIAFTVVGEPVPQPRHRAKLQRLGKKKVVPVLYLPNDEDVRKYKHDVTVAAKAAFHEFGPRDPIAGPVAIEVTFVMARISSMIHKKKAMPREWKATKPDIDNLLKSLFDAINGVIWIDDNQVAKLTAIKIHASGDESPATIVMIQPLESFERERVYDSGIASETHPHDDRELQGDRPG